MPIEFKNDTSLLTNNGGVVTRLIYAQDLLNLLPS